MSTVQWRLAVLAGALLLAAEGGCATPQPVGSQRASAPYGVEQAAPQAMASEPAAEEQPATPFPFLEDVKLTSDQQSRIQAIVKQYQTTLQGQQSQQQADQFKQLLGAPTLDVAALRSLFTRREQQTRAANDALVRMYVSLRGVLTPTQQQQAGAAILQSLQPPPSPSPEESPPPAEPSPAPSGQQLGPDLKLSSQQQALFQAAAPPPPDAKNVLTTLAAFLRSGDSQALARALAPTRSVSDQVKADLAALSSLSYQQRQTLINYKPPSPPPSPPPESSAAQAPSDTQDEAP